MATVTGTFTAAATAGMTVIITVPTPATLFDQISSLEGEDPILIGATGYLDDVFTSRLVGDSQ